MSEVEVSEKDVPLWVNVVVPIVMGSAFIVVLVFLYKTKMEVSVEKLEEWVAKIPLLRNYLSTDFIPEEEDHKEQKKDNANAERSNSNEAPDETTCFANRSFAIDRYDSIAALHRGLATIGDGASEISSPRRSNYHYNMGATISFETNV